MVLPVPEKFRFSRIPLSFRDPRNFPRIPGNLIKTSRFPGNSKAGKNENPSYKMKNVF